MNITKVSNLLNKLVQQSSDLEFYHFGWLSDLNISPQNNFNIDSLKGRLYPSLDWIVPENITFSINEYEKECYKIELYFSDLQGYDNKTAINTRTKNEVWRDLINIAKQFIVLFDHALDFNEIGCIKEETKVSFELDSNSFKDRVQYVKANFEILVNTNCIDVENIIVPTVPESYDIENYKNIFENGDSFELDGVSEYIRATNNDVFNFEWSDTFTFEFWIFVPNPSGFYLYSNWWDQTGIFIRGGGGGGIRVKMCAGANINGRCLDIFTNGGVFNFGVWNHVVLTNDGGGFASSPVLYINKVNTLFSNVDRAPIGAPWSIKQVIRPFEMGANTFFGVYSEAFINLCRTWDIVLNQEDVNNLNINGCPADAIQTDNLIFEMLPKDAIWTGSKFDIKDSTGTQPDLESVLLEEAARVAQSPC